MSAEENQRKVRLVWSRCDTNKAIYLLPIRDSAFSAVSGHIRWEVEPASSLYNSVTRQSVCVPPKISVVTYFEHVSK